MTGGSGGSSGILGAIAGIAIAIIVSYGGYRAYLKWKSRVKPLTVEEPKELLPVTLPNIPKLDMAKVRK
jgi:hypothetical protein